MKASYADLPAGQIHYLTAGHGQPVLLLHQTRSSCQEFSDVVPMLAAACRPIAMDLPGHGDSFLPPADFRIEDHARAVVSLLDALAVSKASMVGIHGGSRIAVEVAATWPERVEKLVLSGCPWYSRDELKALRDNPNYRPIAVRSDGAFLTELWERYKARWRAEMKPEVLCKVMAMALVPLSRSCNLHEAVLTHDIDPRLRLIKSPTLLLSGSGDLFRDRLETVQRLIPHCRTQVIDGAGYSVFLERPRESAQALLSFLTGHTS